ncbi:MAG: hypothetical protein WC291_11730 [Thermodesulfovibrionales bacterium]|jgi:hypothetical protein
MVKDGKTKDNKRPRPKGTAASRALLALRALGNDLLDGTPSLTLNAEQQMIYWKLVALATMNPTKDGVLRHGEGKPMTRGFIARVLGCTDELLGAVIEAASHYQDDGDRIEVMPDGSLKVRDLKKYRGESS